MTTYNGEKYIKDQIESILCQLKEGDELLISDDGSTDKTLKILSDISNFDSRIKIFSGPQKGLQKNFEYVLLKSRGDYIFLCDQDDIWLPSKVALTLHKLRESNLVITDCSVVDNNLQVLHESFFKLNGKRTSLISNLYKNSYLGCCMAFDRAVLDKALPLPNKVPMHDWWIGLVSALYFKTAFIDDSLIMYRRHGFNASSTSIKSKNNIFKKFKDRLLIACFLLKLILKGKK
ncbi:glycosyltransferase family 2 protein [Vibrio cyclitrophicus]